jgi:predicted Zn-dependent peptidase
VVELIGKTFGQITKADKVKGRSKPHSICTTSICKRELEQVHFCLGTKGLQYNHSLRFGSYVLNTILGGGMSSRLFQEIRENRGLAYSVYSYLPAYLDSGLVVVYAGTSESSFQQVIELVFKEFCRLRTEPFQKGEIETAKEQLKGNLLLSLESSDNLMTRLAKNEIYFGSYLPVDKILEGIDRVKEEEVRSLACDFFNKQSFCLTILGPVDGNDFEWKLLTEI